MPRQPTLCYMTPSYRGDMERFALLRRSLRAFSPDIPHVVHVDTEDLPMFRDRFGAEPGLSLVPTADVLPAQIESQRRFWRGWQGRLLSRVDWRIRSHGRFYSGWKLQQVVKLIAAAQAEAEAVVFLDSDIFLCGPVGPAAYFEAGRLRLLETPAETYEDLAFEVSRQLIVGGDLGERARAFNYIHQAPRFLRRTAATLLRHLEALDPRWPEKLFRQPFPSEYNLLGYAARELEQYRDYLVEPSPRAGWVYEVKHREDLEATFETCRQERGRRGFVLVQSNLRMEAASYASAAEALIAELAATDAGRD
jgi:hypothetical protein